jgi:transposase-like protein
MAVCTICADERVLEINRLLLRGGMVRATAKRFGLSEQVLGRHRRRHLRFRGAKPRLAETFEQKLAALVDDGARLQIESECGVNVKAALAVLRERRELLEMEARLAGKISDGSSTNVIVNTGNAAQPPQEVSREEMDRLIQEYILVTGYAKETSATPLLELPPGATSEDR